METSFDAPINEKVELVQVPWLNIDSVDYNLLKNKPWIPNCKIINISCTLNEFGWISPWNPVTGFKTYTHNLWRVPVLAWGNAIFNPSWWGSVFTSNWFWDGTDYWNISIGTLSGWSPVVLQWTWNLFNLYMRDSNNLIRISSATETEVIIRFYLEWILWNYIPWDLNGTIMLQ